MKAIACTKYRYTDVLELKIGRRTTPRDDEVLIKFHAASVNAAGWHLLRADPFLVRLIGIINHWGTEFADYPP